LDRGGVTLTFGAERRRTIPPDQTLTKLAPPLGRILRAPGAETRHAEMARFVSELKNIAPMIRRLP